MVPVIVIVIFVGAQLLVFSGTDFEYLSLYHYPL